MSKLQQLNRVLPDSLKTTFSLPMKYSHWEKGNEKETDHSLWNQVHLSFISTYRKKKNITMTYRAKTRWTWSCFINRMTLTFIELTERLLLLPDWSGLGPGPRPNMVEPVQLTPKREVHANTHTSKHPPHGNTHTPYREVWRGTSRQRTPPGAGSSELQSWTHTYTHPSRVALAI